MTKAGTPTDTVVVIGHQPDAGPGNLATWLDANGHPWSLVDLPKEGPPALEEWRAVVVLGSRESAFDPTVPWLADEVRFLRSIITSGVPVLGLCFGAQLLALGLGGQVRRAPVPERGWIDVMTGAGPSPAGPTEPEPSAGRWLAWHQDEIVAPPGAEVVSRSDRCIQAFRSGPHLGLQFHPEVTASQISAWQRDHRQTDPDAQPDDKTLAADTDRFLGPATAAAGLLYATFFGSRSVL